MKTTYFAQDEEFREISMGMSADYPWALAEGSTLYLGWVAPFSAAAR
ncbi:MAG: hypothetical protein WKG07_33515 [Hymenobacter sp.]